MSGAYKPNPTTNWASPGAIGSSTPAAGTFTTLSADYLLAGSAAASSAYVNLNTAAGWTRDINFQTATVNRWTVGTDSVSESGFNAGSNFLIRAYSDAGAVIDTPLTIPRAVSGIISSPRAWSISNNVSLTGALTVGSGGKLTVSSTEPSSKSIGDLWLELNSGSAFPKYGWEWRWNGTYWLSPDERWKPGVGGVNANTYFYMLLDEGFNYYLKTFKATLLATATQNTSNYWAVDLRTVNTLNSQALLSAFDTKTYTANQHGRESLTVNTHIAVTAGSFKDLLITLGPTNSAGLLYGGLEVVYNLSRP